MAFYDSSNISGKEIFPGYVGKFYHADNMTLVHWLVEPNAPLPEHSHPHEQVVNVTEGEYELVIDGKAQLLKSGDVAVIPANAKHSGISRTSCKLIDAFYPVREDYT